MRAHGIQGAKRRGKPWRTTIPGDAPARPDLVERDFTAMAPNKLWVADFTYLRCWKGVVFFAFVIDVFSRRVVGWQFASHMRTDLVLDALRMALAQRGPGADVALVHHSDRGKPGGINRSSQRLIGRGCGGREATGGGLGWKAGDALAGASAGRPAGASAAVVGGDRAWGVQRGRCGRGGVSAAVGVRWFREGGGMPSVSLAPASGRYLSFAEREEIAVVCAGGCGVREIARRLGRSPSTICRELRRNAATRSGRFEYRATTGQWHADRPAGAAPQARQARQARRESRASPLCAGAPGRTGAASGRDHGRGCAGQLEGPASRPAPGSALGAGVEPRADLPPAAPGLLR